MVHLQKEGVPSTLVTAVAADHKEAAEAKQIVKEKKLPVSISVWCGGGVCVCMCVCVCSVCVCECVCVCVCVFVCAMCVITEGHIHKPSSWQTVVYL